MRSPLTDLSRGKSRNQRMSRAIQARRHLDSPRRGGRAWINGREVGGLDPRFLHLGQSFD